MQYLLDEDCAAERVAAFVADFLDGVDVLYLTIDFGRAAGVGGTRRQCPRRLRRAAAGDQRRVPAGGAGAGSSCTSMWPN